MRDRSRVDESDRSPVENGDAPMVDPRADPPVEVRPVYRLERQEALGIINAYHDSFPVEQRIADSSLIGRIDELPGSNENAFYVAEQGDAIVGFAYILFFPSVRMAHLMYLCVGKWFRGCGAGRALMERLVWRCHRLEPVPRWITVEAARPESARTPDERVAREATVRFLEAVGCRRVMADFQAPPLGPGLEVVPCWAMARPIAEMGVDPASVPQMLLDIYRLVYGIEASHPLVRHCMRSLGRDATVPPTPGR